MEKLLQFLKKSFNNLFKSKDSKYYDLDELKKLQIEIVYQKDIDKQDAKFYILELKKFHHWLKFKGDTCSLFYNNLFLLDYLYKISGEPFNVDVGLQQFKGELQYGVNFLLNEGYENFKLIRDCSYKSSDNMGLPFAATEHEIYRFTFPNNFLPFHNSYVKNYEKDILRSYHTDFFTIFSREDSGVYISVNHNGFLKKKVTRSNSLAKFDYGNISVFYKGEMLFSPEKSNHIVSAGSMFWRHGKFIEKMGFEKNEDSLIINYNYKLQREIIVDRFGLHIFDTNGMYSLFVFNTKLFQKLKTSNILRYSADKVKIYNKDNRTYLKMYGSDRYLSVDF